MGDPFAYRCSVAFSTAITRRMRAQQAFSSRVWRPWEDNHPGLHVHGVRSRASLDFVVLGFTFDDRRRKVAGLSMSLPRGYAVPVRGRMGERWRADMVRLNARPSLDEVFIRHEVPTGYFDFASDVSAELRLALAPEGVVYLACERDILHGQDRIRYLTRVIPEEFMVAAQAAARSAEHARLRARVVAGLSTGEERG